MSTTNNISYQIHHVIPLEILRIHGTRLAKIFGITPEAFMQSYNNRMGLFTDPDQAKIMQRRHSLLFESLITARKKHRQAR